MDVVLLAPGTPPGPLLALGAEHVRTAEGFVAPERAVDVAIACTWEATAHLFSVDARRHVVWVDHFAHHRMGAWQAERIAAQLAYDLPVDFLALGAWAGAALAELRPEARTVVVAPAAAPVDEPLDATAGPLRVLVDDTWLADGAPSPSAAVLAGVAEPVTARALAPGEAPAGADVLLRLDPVDGVLTTPLAAAAAGLAPVVLAAGGQEELVEHLVSGIVAEFDDARGTARWLDHLARDRELLARLRAGARARAGTFPAPDAAAAQLREALERLVAEEPPADARWPTRLMADAMAAVAVHRNDHYVLAEALRRAETDETYLAAQRLRARLDAPGLRAVAPLLRAVRRRAGG